MQTELEAKSQRARMVEICFGKTEVTEAEVIEQAYSKQELAELPELQVHYEYLKQRDALAESAAYITRTIDHGTPVPEELVWLVAHCERILKQNEQLTKKCDRLTRQLDRAKRTSLLPIELRKIFRILGVIITSPPYNFDFKLPKNTATKKIHNMAELKGVHMDEGTILEWARVAAKEIAGCGEEDIAVNPQ